MTAPWYFEVQELVRIVLLATRLGPGGKLQVPILVSIRLNASNKILDLTLHDQNHDALLPHLVMTLLLQNLVSAWRVVWMAQCCVVVGVFWCDSAIKTVSVQSGRPTVCSVLVTPLGQRRSGGPCKLHVPVPVRTALAEADGSPCSAQQLNHVSFQSRDGPIEQLSLSQHKKKVSLLMQIKKKQMHSAVLASARCQADILLKAALHHQIAAVSQQGGGTSLQHITACHAVIPRTSSHAVVQLSLSTAVPPPSDAIPLLARKEVIHADFGE